MKSKLKFMLLWIPIIGLLTMMFRTEFGRYRISHFAGYFWLPYHTTISIIIILI